MLFRSEVIQAVKDGKFHVWAVKTIDEGVEILTGIKAGERKKDGTYPKDTINSLVNVKLKGLADQLVAFGKDDKDKKKPAKKKPAKKKAPPKK